MKNTLLSILATIGVFAAFDASAQPIAGDWNGAAGDLEMANYLDSSATLPAKTTNVFVQSYGTFTNSQPSTVSAANTNLNFLPTHDYAGIGVMFSLTGSATSTNQLLVFGSTNQCANFDATPVFQSGLIAPGNGVSFSTNCVISNNIFNPYTHYGFALYSTGTTAGSNALLELRLPKPAAARPWWDRDQD